MQIYRGWLMVAVAAFIYTVVLGSTANAFGLFVIPVSAELQLSRASMNTAMILISVGISFQAPMIGYLLDRFPIRLVLGVSALTLGAGLAILGFSHSLWLSAATLLIALPLGIEGTTMLTMSVLVARWFTIHRARALTLSTAGLALGGMIMSPVMAWLIASVGWRNTLLMVAAGLTAILLLCLLIIREHPGTDDIEPGRPGTGARIDPPTLPIGEAFTVRGLLAQPWFWLLGITLSVAQAISTTLMISLVPFAIDRGISSMKATLLLSATMAAALVSKLVLASFVEKIDRMSLLIILLFVGAGLDIALMASRSFEILFLCSLVLGFYFGSVPALMQILQVEQFGLSSYGRVRGLMMPISAVATAAGMRVAGEVFDRTGGYEAMFQGFVVIQLAGAAVLIGHGIRRRRPIKHSAA